MRAPVGNYYRSKQRPIESSDDSSDDESEHNEYITPQVDRGLSDTQLKQFLTDIEEGGGLTLFSFKNLCQQKEEIYGEANTAQRSQFRNKLRTLVNCRTERYQLC